MNEIPAAGETFRGDDGTISTILPPNYGQDYEASEGELEEYAEYIGIDHVKEPELMWIAQEGLRAPLPDGWRACQTDDNEVYYFNFQTGDSLWDHPMDEHYKEKVITERAKLRNGGGGRAGGIATALGGSAAAATRTGTTKALTDSLFLRPSNTASGPLSINTTPSTSTYDGASAPRPAPDVSDILNLASAASPLGPNSAKNAAGPFKLKETEAALRKRLEEQNEAQLRTLRIDYGKKEDAERQRLEELKGKLQRELDAAWEREKLSSAAGGGPTANNTAAASTATQRRLQTAREVKQIEESWKSRLHDVSTRVQELHAKVNTQQQTLQKSIYQPPEELRKSLEARNAAEVAQLREAAKKQNEVTLQRLKAEHAAEQSKAAAKSAETVAAAEKLAESNAAQKLQERKVHNAAMLAALQAAVAAKEAELKAQEKTASTTDGAGPSSSSPATSAAAGPQGLSEQDKAAIAAAQAAADAEVAEVKKTNALALTRLREEYDGKRREKEAALNAVATPRNGPNSSRVSSTLQTPTRGLSRATSNNSFSLNAMSPGEQARLDEEDQKLKDEAEKAARIYEEETELMVANREAGRPLTAAPLPAAAANVSAEAVAALGRTATQNQRARDAENARHAMTIKQLEAKHEQAVRLVKTQHDKAMAAASPTSAASTSSATAGAAFNPRQHPSFATQLNARKRAWLRDHPAPSMEMPTLTPIPALPAATMSTTMAAATMPDAEEQAKIVKTRLTQLREELRRNFDREVQALQRGKEGELTAWQEEYRATRLAAVQAAMAALKKEKDAEVEKAKAAAATQTEANKSAEVAATAAAAKAESEAKAAAQKDADAAAAANAAAVARKEAAERATAAATAKLATLQERLQSFEATTTKEGSAGRAAVAALEGEIAQLEAALLQLTSEVDAEEKRRTEVQSKAAAVAAEMEVLQKKQVDATTLVPAATAAAAAPNTTPSPALYIKDAEAMEEEAAVRTRWTALLKTLRAAVEHAMAEYERTLAESSSGKPESVNAAALPPPAPTQAGASYPPVISQEAVSNTNNNVIQNGSGSIGASYGFATPLQRPPLSVSPEYRVYHAEGGSHGVHPDARLFAPPSAQQQHQQQQQQSQLFPSWANTSGAEVQQQQQQHLNNERIYAAASLGGGSGGGRYYDPAMGLSHPGGVPAGGAPNMRAALPMPYYSGNSTVEGSRFLPSSQQTSGFPHERSLLSRGPSFAGPFSAAPSTRREPPLQVRAVEEDQAMRLAALQAAVRERRHELQHQRHDMERLREEWKADMQRCKLREDRAQAKKLKAVKEILEERARRLNEEVLEVKAMQYEIQNEVRRYRQWMQQQEQQQQQVGRDVSGTNNTGNTTATYAFDDDDVDVSSGGHNTTARGRERSRNVYGILDDRRAEGGAAAPAAADVVGLLESIVARTERLENLLLRSARSPSSNTPSPGGDTARR